jgi:hypothetical protein
VPWVIHGEAIRPGPLSPSAPIRDRVMWHLVTHSRRPAAAGESIDLDGLVLLDTVAQRPLDLGAERGPTLLVLIRHRY